MKPRTLPPFPVKVRYHIEVTREDIYQGIPTSTMCNAVSLAIKRSIPEAEVHCGVMSATVILNGHAYYIDLANKGVSDRILKMLASPPLLGGWGRTWYCKPFSFEIEL